MTIYYVTGGKSRGQRRGRRDRPTDLPSDGFAYVGMAQPRQDLCLEAELIHDDLVVDLVAEHGLDHHALVAVDRTEHLSVGAVWLVIRRSL